MNTTQARQRPAPWKRLLAGLEQNTALQTRVVESLETLSERVHTLEVALGRLGGNSFDAAERIREAWLRLLPQGLPGPTNECVDATALGARLGGLTPRAVEQLERKRRLFSLETVDASGRRFPSFQTWPQIYGEPLKRILDVLEPIDEENTWMFFRTQDQALQYLTPLEVLCGRVAAPPRGSLEDDTDLFLSAAHERRVAAVCLAAQVLVSIRSS